MIAPKGATFLLFMAGLIAIYETRHNFTKLFAAPIPNLFIPFGLLLIGVLFSVVSLPPYAYNFPQLCIQVGKFVTVSILGIAFVHWLKDQRCQLILPCHKILAASMALSLMAAAAYLIVLYNFDRMLWGTNILEKTASLSSGLIFLGAFLAPLSIILIRKNLLAVAAFILLVLTTSALLAPSRVFGIFLGCFFALGCFVFNRTWRRVLLATLTATILITPIYAGLFTDELVNLVATYISETSILHRFYIWEFSLQKIFEMPLLGWGLGSSRSIPGGDVMPPYGMAYMPLHPHNGFLQAWLELGLVGAIAICLLCWQLVRRITNLERDKAAIFGSTFVSMLFSFCFYYGLWQTWWLSSIWLSTGICVLLSQQVSSDDHATALDQNA